MSQSRWFAWAALLSCIVAGLRVIAAETAPNSRVLWTASRLEGAAEPPSPYVVERVFPYLSTQFPLYLAPEPGTEHLILVDQQKEDPKPWLLRRFKNSPGVDSAHILFAVTNRQIYGLTFHPAYESNRFFYVFHNGPWNDPSRSNRVSRFTMPQRSDERVDPATEVVVLEWKSAGHDGGDLWFGRDGMLYITSGDGTSDSDTWDSGQDMSRLLAKLLRINVDRPAPGLQYSVPPDNPFVAMQGARPETWAYGFRNPWRMCVDPKSGDIWVGQNGQDLWESACLIEKGANYGWSAYEGSHPFHPHRRRGPTPIVAPIIEHSHADFRSLTGGVVYYGDPLAELNGTYVYGDYSTGKIWGARHRHGKLVWSRELADTSLQIVSFRVDQLGRLLVVDYTGGIYEMRPRPRGSPRPKFPTRLSETGVFASLKDLRPAPGVIPYDVNAPGWSDGAVASRLLALPGTNQITYTATRGWNFNHGSVLVQTLTLDLDESIADAPRRIETRILLKQDGEWNGYSYRWNERQTDATLVGKAGETLELKRRGADGQRFTQSWKIPSRAECMACHARAVNYTLGLSLLQMNRTNSFHRPGENQIGALARLGALVGAPVQIDSTLGHLVNPYEEGPSLGARARSYLHANCSVCHVEAGGGNARMELEFTREEAKMNLLGFRPQHDTFGIQDAMLIAPGDPRRSILVHRLSQRGRGQMPPLVSSRVDSRGLETIRNWIQSLTPEFQFVKEWTMEDFKDVHTRPRPGGDSVRGKELFEKVGCVQCHRIDGIGGAAGPDLSGVGQRMDSKLLLESMLEPSKVVSDEFASHEIETRDGQFITGRIERETSDAWLVRTGSAVEEPVRVLKAHAKGITRSSVSNMPSGILNVLSKQQVLDLMDYVLGGGGGKSAGAEK